MRIREAILVVGGRHDFPICRGEVVPVKRGWLLDRFSGVLACLANVEVIFPVFFFEEVGGVLHIRSGTLDTVTFFELFQGTGDVEHCRLHRDQLPNWITD